MIKSYKTSFFTLLLVVGLFLSGCAAVNLTDKTPDYYGQEPKPYSFSVYVGNGSGDAYPDTIKAHVFINGTGHEMTEDTMLDGITGYGRWYYEAVPECAEKFQYSFRVTYTPRGLFTESSPETLHGMEVPIAGFGEFDWHSHGRRDGQSGPELSEERWFNSGDTVKVSWIFVNLRQLILNQSIKLTDVTIVRDPQDEDPAYWEVFTETPQHEYAPIFSAVPVDLACPEVFPLKVKYTKATDGTTPLVPDEDSAMIYVYAEQSNQQPIGFTIPVKVRLLENPR